MKFHVGQYYLDCTAERIQNNNQSLKKARENDQYSTVEREIMSPSSPPVLPFDCLVVRIARYKCVQNKQKSSPAQEHAGSSSVPNKVQPSEGLVEEAPASKPMKATLRLTTNQKNLFPIEKRRR